MSLNDKGPRYDDLDFPFCHVLTERYEKIHKIGQGTFGEVHKGRCLKTGRFVALKKVLMENEKEGFPITALRELKILQQIKHDNVIELIEICRSKASQYNRWKATFFLVFPYCDNDLAGILHHNVTFSLPAQKSLMKQVLEALCYLHTNGILHRDMKSANLFVTKEGDLKLGDFGLARVYQRQKQAKLTNRVVTLWYRPPELLLGERKYTGAIDMWGVGCVMAELWTKTPILQGTSEKNQLELIGFFCGEMTPETWPGIEQLELYKPLELPAAGSKRKVRERLRIYVQDLQALNLLDKLFTLNPKDRLDAASALDHDFFWSDPDPSKQEIAKTLSTKNPMFEYYNTKARQQPVKPKQTGTLNNTRIF